MQPVKLVLILPDFFRIPQGKLKAEIGPVSGLVYFTFNGNVVAIGESK